MVGRSSKGERVSLLLKLDPKVHEAVKGLAASELRSVTAQIEVLLREAITRRGRRLPPPEEPSSGD